MLKKLSKLLEGGVIIALATFIGYIFAAAYFSGVYICYGIPFNFLNIDITNIIYATVILLFSIHTFISAAQILTQFIPYKKDSIIRNNIGESIIATAIFITLLMSISFLSDFVKLIVVFYLIFMMIIWSDLLVILFIVNKNEKGIMNKWRAAQKRESVLAEINELDLIAERMKDSEYRVEHEHEFMERLNNLKDYVNDIKSKTISKDEKRKKRGNWLDVTYSDVLPFNIRELFLIMTAFIGIILICVAMGYGNANKQKSYLAPKSFPGYLLVSTKNENAILKKYVDGQFVDEMLILPIEDLGVMSNITIK